MSGPPRGTSAQARVPARLAHRQLGAPRHLPLTQVRERKAKIADVLARHDAPFSTGPGAHVDPFPMNLAMRHTPSLRTYVMAGQRTPLPIKDGGDF